MLPLSQDQRVELKGLLEKYRLTGFADRIESLAQGAIQLLPLEPDDYGRVGVTRFGGVPDLPDEVEWPFADEFYLTFVAQINLAEMPALEESPLPSFGWLYFFVLELEDELADNLAHKVIYWPGPLGSLRKREAPEPQAEVEFAWTDLDYYPPYRIAARKLISIPRTANTFIMDDEDAFDDADADNYDDLLDELDGYPDRKKGVSQLLGWPVDIGGDPARAAVFRKHGLYGIRYSYSLDGIEIALANAVREGRSKLADIYRQKKSDFQRYLANKDGLDAEMAEWRLLLELDSHYDSNMCWWDAGKVQFMIHSKDLANQVFDNTYAEILSS